MLEIRDIVRRFGGVRALDGVSFKVSPGEIVGLMGANGAGKTTLFAVIAGNIRPHGGDVIWHGQLLTGLRPDQIARCGIARTYQIVRPFSGLTVLENAAIAARFGARWLRATRDVEREAWKALEVVNLQDRADEAAGALTLSGQKRLEIARAIATGSELLLLDEVMAGLTPPEITQMMGILRDLRARHGITLLVIEHVMRALMELSDRIVVLHVGRNIAEGLPQEIANQAEVSRVYFGSTADA
jgi:branched-chain amino acid transport system ATP-binding protein